MVQPVLLWPKGGAGQRRRCQASSPSSLPLPARPLAQATRSFPHEDGSGDPCGIGREVLVKACDQTNAKEPAGCVQ